MDGWFSSVGCVGWLGKLEKKLNKEKKTNKQKQMENSITTLTK